LREGKARKARQKKEKRPATSGPTLARNKVARMAPPRMSDRIEGRPPATAWEI
jgi:hypothetical protein